jgi:hypothetical protein
LVGGAARKFAEGVAGVSDRVRDALRVPFDARLAVLVARVHGGQFELAKLAIDGPRKLTLARRKTPYLERWAVVETLPSFVVG